jgi:heme-degrading monooxygenase HmoA
MFARFTTVNVKQDKIDEAIAIYKNSVIPAARKQKGFVAAFLLEDRKTGNGVSITFWKAEEDALANEHNRYYQEQIIKFVPLLQTPPIREGYEVTVASEKAFRSR